MDNQTLMSWIIISGKRWAEAPSEVTGPFETKAQATAWAVQNLQDDIHWVTDNTSTEFYTRPFPAGPVRTLKIQDAEVIMLDQPN